jgi:prepilin-type N-terminal cleavage/methylation domain-containing protein
MKRVTKKMFQKNGGFTLMEIMVASTIFVIISASMLSLFNYVLKINRRSEALRQASQSIRNLVELLVKEVRNGQIHYGFVDPGGTTVSAAPGPCSSLNLTGYTSPDNKLALLNTDNKLECFYYGDDTPVTPNIAAGAYKFSAQPGHSYTLTLMKGSLAAQILNPPNLSIDKFIFMVRPLLDPYTPGNPKSHPFVTIVTKFTVRLPTGEQVPMYYQTTVATSKYDVPNSP